MSAFNKFNVFAQDVGRGVHNLHSDTLRVLLSNVAPVATAATKLDITEIAAGFGYTAGGLQVANNTFIQTAGLAKLLGDDIVITAAGGAIGPFQYAVLYNDTSLTDALIGWWDRGATITLNDGEAVTLNLDQVNGILDLQ